MKAALICAVCAGFLGASSVSLSAESDPLLDALSQDIPAAQVPEGYTFFLAQPTARGDEDAAQKVTSRLQFMFTRDGLVVHKGDFGNEGWEGFTYFVFDKPEDAADFKKTDADALGELKVWAGDFDNRAYLDEKAWHGVSTVKMKSSTSGGDVEGHCATADYVIGCVFVEPKSRVAIHLVLQEPKLKDAKSEDEHQQLVTGRVQKEANGLFRTAETHLADSAKASGH